VTTDRGPKPIGPYSQALKRMVYLLVRASRARSKSGELVGAEIRQQTERVLENIKNSRAQGDLHHVIKTTVFLKDMTFPP